MMTNGKITVAIVGGYLLGRTKKAKLAFGLGMLLAGKKITLDPQQLKKSLAGMPLLSGLNGQVRQELVDATRQAATKAVSDRVGGLADSLHERTALLRGESEEGRDEEEDPAQTADAESEPTRKPKPPKSPRKAAAKAPARPARKTAASGAARAEKTARNAGGRNG
ncbi:hypothetical protein ACFY1A_30690 [Streptomyces sp. NPDC001520]|uniref:hypothetical protein n=1 Tax=Streptomyces sp. NPDC001520 TaxID=3364581 RepID=UPI00368D6E15